MKVQIEEGWGRELAGDFEKPYFRDLTEKVRHAYDTTIVYPQGSKIFNAFNLTPFDEVKVVILGQDPYHNEGQAMGLSFSVPDGMELPPSLHNIYTELESDMGLPAPATGDLTEWARQGVFLLNTILTVRAHSPKSHRGWGWETFTDEVIKLLSKKRRNLVFILWGSEAQKKAFLINPHEHLILKGVHPSPLSAYRGFFGKNYFSRANAYLVAHGKSPILWIKPEA